MVKLYDGGVYLVKGREIVPEKEAAKVAVLTGREADREQARQGTIAYSIIKDHNTSGDMDHLKLKFDALTSHDITFVGIIQTARASGMTEFPVPYVLTNCHNSLCAVGGTINEDDHVFGLSACEKYGGIFVPPHIGVIHQYMRGGTSKGCMFRREDLPENQEMFDQLLQPLILTAVVWQIVRRKKACAGGHMPFSST